MEAAGWRVTCSPAIWGSWEAPLGASAWLSLLTKTSPQDFQGVSITRESWVFLLTETCPILAVHLCKWWWNPKTFPAYVPSRSWRFMSVSRESWAGPPRVSGSWSHAGIPMVPDALRAPAWESMSSSHPQSKQISNLCHSHKFWAFVTWQRVWMPDCLAFVLHKNVDGSTKATSVSTPSESDPWLCTIDSIITLQGYMQIFFASGAGAGFLSPVVSLWFSVSNELKDWSAKIIIIIIILMLLFRWFESAQVQGV